MERQSRAAGARTVIHVPSDEILCASRIASLPAKKARKEASDVCCPRLWRRHDGRGDGGHTDRLLDAPCQQSRESRSRARSGSRHARSHALLQAFQSCQLVVELVSRRELHRRGLHRSVAALNRARVGHSIACVRGRRERSGAFRRAGGMCWAREGRWVPPGGPLWRWRAAANSLAARHGGATFGIYQMRALPEKIKL